ncbi:MAG: type II toxin-antitoxin system VapC family toxin [Roseiarcus sp.]
MRLLLDTHILVWIATDSPRLSRAARAALSDPTNEKAFSAVSVWELAIKATGRPSDIDVDLDRFEQKFLARGYRELAISCRAARETAKLPRIHKDPFDRLLIAQAIVEGLTLLTADATVARYGGPVRLV